MTVLEAFITRTVAFAAFAIVGAVTLASMSAVGAAAKSRAAWKKTYARPATVPFPRNNPYTAAKADLGRKLFFDPRLSGANDISCGSCHSPGFAWGDGRARGIGHAMARLSRRTPTILNRAWAEQLMWDGRFETLEEQVLAPLSAPDEMNQDMGKIVAELRAIPEYRTLFDTSFPGVGISVRNIANALATFERTVVSGIAPFDRWIAGDERAISAAAKRGFDLFNNKAHCVACHSGWNFTDDSFHDTGLPDDDIGRGKILQQAILMQHAFKVPTLRNVAERGPYMHDGSLKDLLSVIRHYNDGFRKRPSKSVEIFQLHLSEREQADLVAFLKTLSSVDAPTVRPSLRVAALATAGPSEVTVTQKNKKFDRREITIAQGDTVRFVNADAVSHNIYSVSPPEDFDLGIQGPGTSSTHTFSRKGTFKVRCIIHSRMKLTVKVK